MSALRRGFTLIELMITIAILGILTTLAMPMYQDYGVRAKVVEGLNLSGPIKLAVAEAYFAKGSLPADNHEADLPAPQIISSRYVDSVTVTDGVITIAFVSRGMGGKPAMNGIKVKLLPFDDGGALAWTCSVDNQTELFKYVPKDCRN
jgi:type IV pilus assembly protein PilA